MKLGEYIELYWGDDYLPEYEIFYGHLTELTWAESWKKFAGNDWLKRCKLKIEYTYGRLTKHTVSFSETPKQGFSKITKVYWDRAKFDNLKD